MTIRRRVPSLTALILGAVLALPGLAAAETLKPTASTKPHPVVAEQLQDLKNKAFEIRREADYLNSFASNRQLSWQSHSTQQTAVKEHINQMGRMLTQLEGQMAIASDTQRIAIEQARPHLAGAAQHLTRAMEMVGERRSHIGHPDYAAAVRSVYDHSDALCEKLDAILDYDNSKLRFDRLELPPAAEAS